MHASLAPNLSPWEAVLELTDRLRLHPAGRWFGLVEDRDHYIVVDDPAADADVRVRMDAEPVISKSLPDEAKQLFTLYLALCTRPAPFAVAHLGQSLDGRIATTSGASQYVTGPEDILHNHRMRALCDVVLVGAGTVAHDDPRLSVRLCDGESPIRAVIDTERRLSTRFRVFADGEIRTLLFTAEDQATSSSHGHAEVIGVPRAADGLDPHAIRSALEDLGLARIFIEGGGVTVSRFLDAEAINQLQITVAPIIIGSGKPAIRLPEIGTLNDCLRPRTQTFSLGQDVLFLCELDA